MSEAEQRYIQLHQHDEEDLESKGMLITII